MDDIEKLLNTGTFPAEVPSEPRTADDMFRELGYLPVEDNGYRMYQNSAGIVFEFYERNVAKWSRRFPEKRIDITTDEILACAQLIREMGAAK